MQVIAGLSLPGGDTVQVGRRAGAAFLKNLNGNVGLVLPVPPHGRVPLVTQRFAPGLTVSGIMQMQSLSGGPLTVRVGAGGDTDTLTATLARVFTAGTGGSALAAPSGRPALRRAEAPSPYVFPPPAGVRLGDIRRGSTLGVSSRSATRTRCGIRRAS